MMFSAGGIGYAGYTVSRGGFYRADNVNPGNFINKPVAYSPSCGRVVPLIQVLDTLPQVEFLTDLQLDCRNLTIQVAVAANGTVDDLATALATRFQIVEKDENQIEARNAGIKITLTSLAQYNRIYGRNALEHAFFLSNGSFSDSGFYVYSLGVETDG
jgi:hypothetical protein